MFTKITETKTKINTTKALPMHCALPAPYTLATVEGAHWKEACGLCSLLYHLSHARSLNSQVSGSHPRKFIP